MIKGVFVGFGVMFVVLLIPIIHPVMFVFGPFIGGYYGINTVEGIYSAPGRKSLEFGIWTGLLMLVVFAISAGIVDSIFDIENKIRILIWGGVWVGTFYYGSMSGLGAWYSVLKAKG